MSLITRLMPRAAILLGTATAALATVPASHPYPGGEGGDIWMLAGQSNMQGYGLLTGTRPVNPQVLVFGLNNEWMPATAPTHRVYTAAAPAFEKVIRANNPGITDEIWRQLAENERKSPANLTGPELSFADYIVGVTGRSVGLLPCALGGTSMAQWSPARRDEGNASLYGAMIERIRMVGGRIKGVLWYQGESDAGTPATVEGYTTALLDLVDSLRRDTGIPDLPIIYVQISRFALENQDAAAGWESVREQQRTAAARRPNLWMVPAIDLPLDDLIHIGAEGHAKLGRRLAQVALTHVYGLRGHGTPIDFASCEVLPPLDTLHHRLRVRFSGVTGALQAAGRPAGFALRSGDPKREGPAVYKVELDQADPAAVIVWYSKPITAPVQLYYAPGLDPYANLTDSVGMAVPAFGPVTATPRP